VAVGFLATNFSANPYNKYVENVFTAKPQYLFNTADRSEIASVRLIYAPWTDFPNVPINLNTFQLMPLLPGPVWGTLLFDVRNDAGIYTNWRCGVRAKWDDPTHGGTRQPAPAIFAEQ
jgi:hypothetical protein